MYLCPHHKKCDIFVTSSLALAVSSSSDFVTPKRLTQVGQEIIQVLYPPALLLVDALPFLSLASSFLFFFFRGGICAAVGLLLVPSVLVASAGLTRPGCLLCQHTSELHSRPTGVIPDKRLDLSRGESTGKHHE